MSSYKNGELLAIEYNVWISGKKLGMDKKQCINNIHLQNVTLLLYTLILMTVTNITDFFFFCF